MNINELKELLQIHDDSRDPFLTLKLAEAIDFVQGSCNQNFIKEDVLTLPATAKGVIATYVQYELNGNTGVKSESMAGMSQSFESSEERDNALIKRLSVAGLRKIKFIPIGRRRVL
ncbi:phage head-tail connector protein [Psychrobacillus sp. FSL K6-4615]|uniref:phage head-tail connector protein n=1 Tax=Psychrobacillus sp. FSL K6-4615 TaxID=2921551 RepID=UPI0030FAB863